MNRALVGKLLLTSVLVVGTVASFILDWSENHLLNPLWHPHARFHGGLLLFMLAGTSATGVWLLWRRSAEPYVAAKTAALLALSFWTPLFYANSLIPGSSLWAGVSGQEPRWQGYVVYPNLIVAAIFVVVTVMACGLCRPVEARE
jgi:hypothetical protein